MKIAAAPVSWGIFEVTLRDDLPPGPTYLNDVVECGYAGTESGPPGYLGQPEDARRLLADRDLEMVGTFLPYDFATPGIQARSLEELVSALDLIDLLTPPGSSPVIILSDDYQREERMAVAGKAAEHPEVALPKGDWPGFVAAVNDLAVVCADRGFTVAFHPHVGSYVETPEEIERLASGLDESSIGLCMDIGHVTFGGGNALELTKTYAGLTRHVHAKDVDAGLLEKIVAEGGGLWEAWEQGVFCDLGTGTANVSECLVALDEHGYTGWAVVEQDTLPSGAGFLSAVRASQKRNREYLANLGW